MKRLKSSIAVLTLCAAFVSCEKQEIVPTNPIVKPSTSGTEKAPTLIALSTTAANVKGATRIYTVFQSTTANFYGSTLYAHYRVGTTGAWSNGTAVSSWSNPNATYNLPIAFITGTNLNVFYSTSQGTSYPSGSASAIYTNVIVN
ncbi:MAG: hypothetical protein ACK476_17230 [Fluviicola sp.]|jgi:hypothetical protein